MVCTVGFGFVTEVQWRKISKSSMIISVPNLLVVYQGNGVGLRCFGLGVGDGELSYCASEGVQLGSDFKGLWWRYCC